MIWQTQYQSGVVGDHQDVLFRASDTLSGKCKTFAEKIFSKTHYLIPATTLIKSVLIPQ